MKKGHTKTKHDYTDVSNVETQKNFLFPEGLPEGAYGSPVGKHTPVEGKSGPWLKGQRNQSAFDYQFNTIQENVPRRYPGVDNPSGNYSDVNYSDVNFQDVDFLSSDNLGVNLEDNDHQDFNPEGNDNQGVDSREVNPEDNDDKRHSHGST